jgi:hypothetical protein
MKGFRVKLVSTTMAIVAIMVIAWTVRHQQIVPQTCPFDPNLSVGLAFQGPHFYFHTSEIRDAILNARMAWFQSTEAPNPIMFESRIIQEPPDEDWVWWETRFPTTLVIQITDTKGRLGKVEVWDFERNLLDGILNATPNGSAVIGTVILNESTSFRLVNIKDKNEQILAKLLIQNPKIVLHAHIIYARWVPHPPICEGVTIKEIGIEEHTHPVEMWDSKSGELRIEEWNCTIIRYQLEGCPNCTGMKEQHKVSKGTVSQTLNPPPQGCSILDTRQKGCGAWVEIARNVPGLPCTMVKRVENPSEKEIPVLPPHEYYLRRVVQFVDIDTKLLDYLTPTARKYVEDYVLNFQGKEIAKIDDKEIILDDTPAFAIAKVKPYSLSCVHWNFSVDTKIRAFYVFPEIISQKPEFSLIQTLLDWIGFRINQSKNPMTFLLFEGLRKAWEEYISQREEVKKAKIGPKDLLFYGDVWVTYVFPRHIGGIEPYIAFERNITQDVEIQIIVAKKEGKEPIEGSVSFQKVEALTTPSPPDMPLGGPIEQPVFVPKEGTKIPLGMGWKWRLTVTALGRTVSQDIKVPPTTSVVIEVPPHQQQPPEPPN